jgi:hypothetical protein
LDILLLVLPHLGRGALVTGHDALALAVLAGIPMVQLGLVLGLTRVPHLKWALISISLVWFVAIVLVAFEGALIYIPTGALWVIGAVDRPKVS